MFSDALVTFVPQQTPLSLVGLASARSLIYDFAGVGVGVAPPNIFGSTLFGQPDAMGVGSFRPELAIATGASNFVGANVTLNIQLQVAADNGAGGAPPYNPATWTTISESGAIPVGTLLARTPVWRQPWIPPAPMVNRPRFISLNFVVAGGQFTTAQIAYAWITMGRDDLTNNQAARNFTV